MIEATIKVFSITLEIYFSRPKPFSKDKVDLIAEWLASPTTGFGLRPDQIRARHTDIVFDYELAANFYGGNASFVFNAEKAVLTARGARTRQDAQLLQNASIKFAEFLASEEKLSIVFSANAHAALPSFKDREIYLDGIRPNARVINPGVLGYVRVEGLADTVRIAIEPSFSDAQSLFFAWQLNMDSSLNWQDTFEKITGIIEDTASIYGIQFHQLEEQ